MEQTFIVTENDTAKALGSGLLPVLSTPRLVAMVENTCLTSISDQLAKGDTTVGVKMNLDHLKATKVGEEVVIKSQLEKMGKTSFTFTFEAFSKDELIAKGDHLRVRVEAKSFMEKLN